MSARFQQRAARECLEKEKRSEIRIATVNVCTLTGNLAEYLELAKDVDILCTQETRHDVQTMATIRAAAAFAGWTVYFGEPMLSAAGIPVGGVAIFTKWPCEFLAIELKDELDAAKRTIAVKAYRPELPPLLVYNLYLDASDTTAAALLGDRIFEAAAKRAEDKVIVGDWNRTPWQTPATTALATGTWKCSDEERSTPTRHEGRLIDFMVHLGVDITSRWQIVTKSDHDMVCYGIGIGKVPPTFKRGPTRELRSSGYVVTEADWKKCFASKQLAFEGAIKGRDAAEAWRLLSDTAEELLAMDNDQGGRPRGREARPMSVKQIKTRVKDVEGIAIVRLRKLRRRIAELQRPGKAEGAQNLAIIVKKDLIGFGSRFGELATLDMEAEDACSILDGLIDDQVWREKEGRLRRWFQKLEDERLLMKWITKEADKETEKDPEAGAEPLKPLVGPQHPQEVIETEAKKWETLWNPPKEEMPVLADALRHDDWTHYFRHNLEAPWLEGKELKRIVDANVRKACGIDEWTPLAWSLLPESFFDGLAAVWNVVIHAGAKIPKAWLQVRVVLLPKEEGGLRPLSIAVLAWRTGLAAILKRTDWRQWICGWLTEEIAGGVPGASPQDIHDQLKEDILNCIHEGEDFCGGKVDLRKCFDKASAEIGIALLVRLGMPKEIATLLKNFYAEHEKYFEKDGAVARDAVKVINSLLQGCPMSMLLLAVQSVLWVRGVKKEVPEISIGIFVDDRSLLARGDYALADLDKATAVGDEIDADLGWAKHPEKLQCYGKGKGMKRQLQLRRDTLGPFHTRFKLLGVKYSIDRAKLCQESDNAVYKMLRRLDRIRCGCKGFYTRRRMIRTLVLPILKYPGAWAAPTKRTLRRIETKIEYTMLGRQIRGRSRFLLWNAALDADINPGHCLNLEALRHESWRLRKRAQRRIEGKPVPAQDQQAGRWPKVAELWEWQKDGQEGGWNTLDGYINLGEAGKPAVEAFTRRAFMRTTWAEDNRCDKDLPKVLRARTIPALDAHKAWCKDFCSGGGTGARRLKTALGAACDHKVVASMIRDATVSVTCMCGRPLPDREHWMWHCTVLEGTVPRQTTRHRLAERKLGIFRMPAGKLCVKDQVKDADIKILADGIKAEVLKGVQAPTVATDGGATGKTAFARAAAWAAVTEDAGVSGSLLGIDSSSYYAEIFGALVAMCAIAEAKVFCKLVIDNRAVQAGLNMMFDRKAAGTFVIPKQYALYWERIYGLNAECRTYWIPSHGKRTDWKSPLGENASTEWRRLNDKADKLAAEAAKDNFEKLSKTDGEKYKAQPLLERAVEGSTLLLEKYLRT